MTHGICVFPNAVPPRGTPLVGGTREHICISERSATTRYSACGGGTNECSVLTDVLILGGTKQKRTMRSFFLFLKEFHKRILLIH